MGCALGCAKLLPGAALLLGETKQSWQSGRNLKAQVLNSSSVKAFHAPEQPAQCRCIQWPVLFRQWKMSWKLQLFFSFGSDNSLLTWNCLNGSGDKKPHVGFTLQCVLESPVWKFPWLAEYCSWELLTETQFVGMNLWSIVSNQPREVARGKCAPKGLSLKRNLTCGLALRQTSTMEYKAEEKCVCARSVRGIHPCTHPGMHWESKQDCLCL